MRKLFLAMVLVMLVVATAAADTIIYPIGQASTAGFNNGAGTGETARGWDFVISQPITVVQLGVNAGVSMDITMTLWDVTTQTILAQTTVTSQPFAWEFATLAVPVSLTPGDTFSVIGWADAVSTPWYIFNNTPPAEFNPTGIVTYLNTRFDNGIGPNVFPLGTLGAPAQYGVTDIGYTLGGGVPEPGTLAMIGGGIGMVGVLRRKLNF